MRNLFAILITASISCISTSAGAEPGDDAIKHLQETIRQQQQRLDSQAERIRTQGELLNRLKEQVDAMQKKPLPASTEVILPKEQPALVASGNDRVSLSISGQIDRAMNIINDGAATRLYHVDNDASNTRFRLVGKAKVNSDVMLGARLEMAVAPDESSQVSQLRETSGDYLNVRWAEASIDSGKYGRLSIGKGDTASNTTAENDLSKTDVVQYSSISDVAAGMLFREKTGNRALTAIRVADAFKNGDGLSRQSRLRYDTPSLYGFTLSGSLVSNQQSDIAISWAGEGLGFKGVGAFAVSNPRTMNSTLLYDGSFSLLHTATGLNLTIAGALLDNRTTRDRTNIYAKAGWLTNLPGLGFTAFGIDYTRSEQSVAQGDRGYSAGAAVVQGFDRFATEVYIQYRIFHLDRQLPNRAVADMNVGTIGARIKF